MGCQEQKSCSEFDQNYLVLHFITWMCVAAVQNNLGEFLNSLILFDRHLPRGKLGQHNQDQLNCQAGDRQVEDFFWNLISLPIRGFYAHS